MSETFSPLPGPGSRVIAHLIGDRVLRLEVAALVVNGHGIPLAIRVEPPSAPVHLIPWAAVIYLEEDTSDGST